MNTTDVFPFISIGLKQTFKNNAYQLKYSNKFIKDIEDIDRQKEILKQIKYNLTLSPEKPLISLHIDIFQISYCFRCIFQVWLSLHIIT